MKDHWYQSEIWTDTIEKQSGWFVRLRSGTSGFTTSGPHATHSEALSAIDKMITEAIKRAG